MPSAGRPGPQPGKRKANESRTFPLRGGSIALALSRIPALSVGPSRWPWERESSVFCPPTLTHPLGSQGGGRQRQEILAGRRCSSDLCPLDVFAVNRNCRALSAPGARASVSPAAFGSLVFCWTKKPFSFFLMVPSPPCAPNPASGNPPESNAGSLWGFVGTALAIGIFL